MTTKNRTVAKLLTASNVDLYTVPANYETNVQRGGDVYTTTRIITQPQQETQPNVPTNH